MTNCLLVLCLSQTPLFSLILRAIRGCFPNSHAEPARKERAVNNMSIHDPPPLPLPPIPHNGGNLSDHHSGIVDEIYMAHWRFHSCMFLCRCLYFILMNFWVNCIKRLSKCLRTSSFLDKNCWSMVELSVVSDSRTRLQVVLEKEANRFRKHWKHRLAVLPRLFYQLFV